LYIFAATDDGRIRGKRLQFIAQLEGLIQRVRERSGLLPSAEQITGSIPLLSCGQARDLSFHQRRVYTANACRLPGTVDVRQRTFLKVVYGNIPVNDHAAEKLGELDVWHKVKSTGEHVALYVRGLAETGDRDASQF
jgi:hypothetical protein